MGFRKMSFDDKCTTAGLLRDAALKVDGRLGEVEGSMCHTIDKVWLNSARYLALHRDAAHNAVDMFRRPHSRRAYWGEEFGDTEHEVNECRVLALLFAADMVEQS